MKLFGIQVLVFIALLALVEGVCRLVAAGFSMPRSHFTASTQFWEEGPKHEVRRFQIPSSIDSVRSHKPYLISRNRERIEEVEDRESIERRGVDEISINRPGTWRVQYLADGRPYADVKFEFDKNQFRKIPAFEGRKAGLHFLTLGCSQTLGHGLAAEDTLAGQFARHDAHFKPYILAQQGGDPSQILYLERKFDSFGKMDVKRGIAVLRLFNYHFPRFFHSFSQSVAIQHHVKAERGKSGQVEVLRPSEAANPFWSWTAKLWAQSGMAHFFTVDWPLYYTDHHLQLMADTISALRDDYRRQTDEHNPFVVILSGDRSGTDWSAFVPYLERNAIQYFDFGAIPDSEWTQPTTQLHPNDLHYNAAFNDAVATVLRKDLQPLIKSLTN